MKQLFLAMIAGAVTDIGLAATDVRPAVTAGVAVFVTGCAGYVLSVRRTQ